MSCVEWEERVALHAGGDLAGPDAAAVEQHLGECPVCQMLWSGLRDGLAVLQAAHVEVLSAAHFTVVRSRVMAELEHRARPWWKRPWVYGFTVAAATVLVLLAAWPRGPVPTAPRTVASIPPAPLVAAVRNAATAPSRSRLQLEPRASAGGFREPVTVKLQTSDPNIVIYWIAD